MLTVCRLLAAYPIGPSVMIAPFTYDLLLSNIAMLNRLLQRLSDGGPHFPLFSFLLSSRLPTSLLTLVSTTRVVRQSPYPCHHLPYLGLSSLLPLLVSAPGPSHDSLIRLH